MTEPRADYNALTVALPQVEDGSCSCGWPFGKPITITKRYTNGARYEVHFLVLYGSGLRVRHLVCECPACGKEFGFHGGKE